ncbi:MAG: GIY-YIG nuclease family protein [Sedimentisphaerales bacterium]|nr:GIY-YIG nuclease family protein [Sedimentisphaerales bacterium]
MNHFYRKRNYNPASWVKNDEKADCFYAYVEKLSDGSYYCGSTRDLKLRVIEHRDGQTKSTAGKNPKLKYFEIWKTRKEAEDREKYLRDLDKKNHREFLRIIIRWQEIACKVDYEI